MNINNLRFAIDCRSSGSIDELINFTFVALRALYSHCASHIGTYSQVSFEVVCYFSRQVVVEQDLLRSNLPKNFVLKVVLSNDDIHQSRQHPYWFFQDEEGPGKEVLNLLLVSGDFFPARHMVDALQDSVGTIDIRADRIYISTELCKAEFQRLLGQSTSVPTNCFDIVSLDNLALNCLHPDEAAISSPGYQSSVARRGVLMWHYPGELLIRYQVSPEIFCFTADNSYEGLTNNGTGQHSVTGTALVQILNVKPATTSVMPLEEDCITLLSRAMHWSAIELSFLKNTLASPLIVTGSSVQAERIEYSKDYIDSLLNWIVAFKNISPATFEEKIFNIKRKYERFYSLSMKAIEKKLSVIESQYIGKTLVLYGMGEFGQFINHFFQFSQVKIVFSDREYLQLQSFFTRYPVVPPESIINAGDVVLLLSVNFLDEMEVFLRDLHGEELEVISIRWDSL